MINNLIKPETVQLQGDPTELKYCQTPNLVLGLGVDFTFPYNNNKNNKNKKNPHLIFHRREGTRGLKFVKQT